MAEKKSSDGNVSATSVSFKESAEGNKSWHSYQMSGWEHRCDALPISESILLVHSLSTDKKSYREAFFVSLYLCEFTSSSFGDSLFVGYSKFPERIFQDGPKASQTGSNDQ